MKVFKNLLILMMDFACSLTLQAANNEPDTQEALAFLSEAESRLEEASHKLIHTSCLKTAY